MQGTILARRYLVADVIGEGGMGSVYRATDLRTGGTVAIKVVQPALARDSVYRERLRREAQLAASLVSPRIVRVTDLDEHEGVPFLVMEYVAGPTLEDVLRERDRLPLVEALAITLEVTRALESAHAAGIVHRDLKPANIKLVEGQVKVLDFGIARAGGSGGLTTAGDFIGTPEYSAPERAAGQGDIRADIYAVGAILFTLLEGRSPFQAPTPLAVLYQHATAPVPRLSDDVPGPVQEIVARCLAKSPTERYQTPAELAAALAAALRDVQQTAPVPVALMGPMPGEAADGRTTPPDDRAVAKREQPALPAAGRRGTLAEAAGRPIRGRMALIAGIVLVAALIAVLALRLPGGGDDDDPPRVGPTAGDEPSGTVTTLGSATFAEPRGVAVDAAGDIYVAETEGNRILKVTPQGTVTAFAGTGEYGSADGPADVAQFASPTGIAVDKDGNVYVTEPDEQRVRRITPQGTVSTFASGEEAFQYPYGIAADGNGNVYVADRDGHRVQKITPQGAVMTLAGNGQAGYEDGPGASAQFRRPHGVAVDSDGTVYVADTDNERIRRITPDGVVSTLAGGDEGGYADGLGDAARFASPLGIAVGPASAVYVADWQNHRVRRVTQEGRVTTIAGSGEQGFADGPLGVARFGQSEGIAVDRTGVVYVADSENNRVRTITLGTTR